MHAETSSPVRQQRDSLIKKMNRSRSRSKGASNDTTVQGYGGSTSFDTSMATT